MESDREKLVSCLELLDKAYEMIRYYAENKHFKGMTVPEDWTEIGIKNEEMDIKIETGYKAKQFLEEVKK